MSSVQKAKSQRAAYRGWVTQLMTSDITEESNLEALRMKADKYIKKLNELDEEVMSYLENDEEIRADVTECCEIQDKLTDFRANVGSKILEINSVNDADQKSVNTFETASTTTKKARAKLPQLELPKFDGDPLHWRPFWHSFSASIHDNQELANVDKFTYLRSLLSGYAFQVIEGISVTNDDYDEAVSLLEESFGKKQIIVNAHIERLLDIPQVSQMSQLRHAFLEIEKHVRGLDKLGVGADTYGIVITPIILKKLPSDVRHTLSRNHRDDIWDLNKLRVQLKDEIDAYERGCLGSPNSNKINSRIPLVPQQIPNDSQSTVGSFFAGKGRRAVFCAYCRGGHPSAECHLSIQDRWNRAKDQKLCHNCLRNNHFVNNCRDKACHICNKSHHISLCTAKSDTSNQSEMKDNVSAVTLSVSEEVGPNESGSPCLLSTDESVLMLTAVTTIFSGGQSQKVRILFDNGSQHTFVTQSLVDRLSATPRDAITMSIARFQSDRPKSESFPIVDLGVQCSNNRIQNISALIVPTITCPLYRAQLCQADRNSLQGFPLADPFQPGSNMSIDILVGLTHYWDFIDGTINRFDNGIVAVSSSLGWMLSGVVSDANKQLYKSYGSFFISANKVDLDDQIKCLWDLETMGIAETEVTETDQILSDFNGFTKLINNRYFVHFPWKNQSYTSNLPDNRYLALKRAKATKLRLLKDPKLLHDYDEIIKEQLNKGFIEPVDEKQQPSGIVHYIPHHPVIKINSDTTKVRIVYDASARIHPGSYSLNDVLYDGPNMIGNLFAILLRFRLRQVGICADIEKAFLQVGLFHEDRDCTRFFWFDKPDSSNPKLIVYRFAVIPFGVVSSPFLLNATLLFHLSRHQSDFAARLQESFYVDNTILSLSTDEEAKRFYKESKSMMHDAGMNLREWYSNRGTVVNEIATADRGQRSTVTVLGLLWHTESDELSIRPPASAVCHPVTKRFVLHYVSTIFDPLGFVTPVVIRGKLFMQKLWLRHIPWDNEIPSDLLLEWQAIRIEFEKIPDIRIPRWFNIESFENANFQLHAFADASQSAYAVVIYLREDKNDGNAIVHFVTSKARVAPVKSQNLTIPRLELMAVELACRMIRNVQECFHIPVMDSYCWSDSQITLAWIHSDKRLKEFVRNRVATIHKSKVNCQYVPTGENSADIGTRGKDVSDFQNSHLWWHGPPWLKVPENEWPKREIKCDSVMLIREIADEPSITKPSRPIDINQFSSLSKLLRVTAYCFRFGMKDRPTGPLTADELHKARQYWDLSVQKECFPLEFNNAGSSTRRPVGLVKQLGLFLNKEGSLLCQGRIHNANVPYSTKNPKLLPCDHKYTQLVIFDCHQRLYHQGVRHTMTTLRREYWVPRCRQQIQKVIRKCVVCRKWEGRPYDTPPMPPLPAFRVTEMPAFSFVGVDFAGPLYVKEGKVWICLFTCAVSRALHLELVRDMTTVEFILCLRRFIGRRGTPNIIVSDNAKTFKLAKTTLEYLWVVKVTDTDVMNFMSDKGIKWIFNVERAPWWGGFFERMVGLTKRALRKGVGKQKLSYVELETQLVEIEAILNSRPITYVYSHLDDGSPLSPNDLCGCRRTVGFPNTEMDILDPDYLPNLQTAEQVAQKVAIQQSITKRFWDIWKTEYLTQLREYHQTNANKHKPTKTIPIVGDVVIIKSDLPRCQWHMGLVIKELEGNDGITRAAVVKTATTTLQRPVQLLIPLEIQHEDITHTQNYSENYSNCSEIASDGASVSTRITRSTAAKQKQLRENM